MYKLVAFMIIVYIVFVVWAGLFIGKKLSSAVESYPECVSEVCA